MIDIDVSFRPIDTSDPVSLVYNLVILTINEDFDKLENHALVGV